MPRMILIHRVPLPIELRCENEKQLHAMNLNLHVNETIIVSIQSNA